MARKFRFQKIRTDDQKNARHHEDRNAGHIVFEPVDIALIVMILLVAVWLQWLMGALA